MWVVPVGDTGTGGCCLRFQPLKSSNLRPVTSQSVSDAHVNDSKALEGGALFLRVL